jgi:hypothetical protein
LAAVSSVASSVTGEITRLSNGVQHRPLGTDGLGQHEKARPACLLGAAMNLPVRRLRTAVTLIAAGLLGVAMVLAATPANAAVLFSDNFEQPTYNVWQTGSGGTWSFATEDGSTVWKQSSTALTPTAYAGSGSGTGTTVTARIKPTSPLTGTSLVSVAGRVANPNNLYYAGVHGSTFEIGLQGAGTTKILATTPFTVSIGTWYTVSLGFPTAGTVVGTVTAPGGNTASLHAADPGGVQAGDKVGFYMRTASASLDDISLTNTLPPPPPPTGPCVASIAVKVSTNFGTGYLAYVSLTNTSAAPITPPWTITWRMGQGQYLQNVFGAGYYQVGQTATLTSPSYATTIAPGVTATNVFGFQAATPAVAPTNATFNGVACPLTFS